MQFAVSKAGIATQPSTDLGLCVRCRYLPFLCELNPAAASSSAGYQPRGTLADRATVVGAYEVIAAMEHPLQVALVECVKRQRAPRTAL
jgi:hypothetical protein